MQRDQDESQTFRCHRDSEMIGGQDFFAESESLPVEGLGFGVFFLSIASTAEALPYQSDLRA